MLIFMILLLTHLLADFVLQRNAVIAGKVAGRWAAWAEHAVMLQSFTPDEADDAGQIGGLADAGLRIGWLERFLMLSAFLVQAWAALGLVLAAKSVFRFEDLRKGRRHAEYFLIGTLVSLSQVVLFGILLKLILLTLETA